MPGGPLKTHDACGGFVQTFPVSLITLFVILSVQEEAAALELQACLLISAGQCLGGGLLVVAWQGGSFAVSDYVSLSACFLLRCFGAHCGAETPLLCLGTWCCCLGPASRPCWPCQHTCVVCTCAARQCGESPREPYRNPVTCSEGLASDSMLLLQ